MTFRVTIGIDPGASGALAVLADGVVALISDMPVSARKAGGQQVNAIELCGTLRDVLNRFQGASILVVLEQVAAMPGQGVSSMFRFGDSVGVVRGVTGALRLPMILVSPQVWKRHHGLIGSEKDVSRTRAIELFPLSAQLLARKKDVGRADALLMAAWATATDQAARAA